MPAVLNALTRAAGHVQRANMTVDLLLAACSARLEVSRIQQEVACAIYAWSTPFQAFLGARRVSPVLLAKQHLEALNFASFALQDHTQAKAVCACRAVKAVGLRKEA